MVFLKQWLVASAAVFITFLVAQGIYPASFYHLVMISITLGLIDAGVPYLVNVASFGRTAVTVGLMTLAVNAFFLYMVHVTGAGIAFASLSHLFTAAVISATIAFLGAVALLKFT